MAIRDSHKHTDVVEKEPVAPVKKATYNYVRQSIRSLVEARILFDGSITGEHYEWSRAGSVVSVDERDVPELLAKRLGQRNCCGASDFNHVFELI